MSQQLILALVGAIAIVLAAILGVPRFSRDMRSGIAKDLEIYKALPQTSPVRDGLLEHIEQRVRQLSVNDQAKRSPGQIALGVSILVIAFVMGWFMVVWNGWWWLASPVVLFLLILAGVGIGQGAKKAQRDNKGNLAG